MKGESEAMHALGKAIEDLEGKVVTLKSLYMSLAAKCPEKDKCPHLKKQEKSCCECKDCKC